MQAQKYFSDIKNLQMNRPGSLLKRKNCLLPIRYLVIVGFLIVLVIPAFSQFQLSDAVLQKGELVLHEGWKYMEGDNADWANPETKDDQWKAIDPTLDLVLAPVIIPGKVYWFRLHLNTEGLSTQQLAMIIQQSGASEFYIDGKLIHRFGTIQSDQKRTSAYDPLYHPAALILPDSTVHHVLAIRYVLEPDLHYTTIFESRNAVFHIRLSEINAGLEYFSFYRSLMVGFLLLIIGTCLLQSILHFAFFVFYPAQKANLSIALYAVLFLLFNIIQYRFFLESHSVEAKFYLANFAMDLRSCCSFFLLSALYKILDQPRDRIYWLLVCLLLFSFVLNIWPYDKGWKMGGALMEVFVGAGVTRVAYKAVKQKISGAWIILCGAIGYFVAFGFFFSYIFNPDNAFLQNLSPTRIVFYVVSFLCIPVSTSIFLGYDFALTNKRLQQKLNEIEKLSAKSLQQELEKQEILARQNETLEQQVNERTHELSDSLKELKSTQTQLIQREKMASLGELTAGIAHEIQNPLNFVNNFSEVNKELLTELKEGIQSGKMDDVLDLTEDLIANEEKINLHGKRADSIVKSMLQHSRLSAGQKEPTDINALADEYLRLSFHGLKAKDKSFNAKIETAFDPSLPPANLVSQDIGRVLLNLFNNAFYAVREKAKLNIPGYEPLVKVSTTATGNNLQIEIADNGIGIPENIADKIFQPFYTTKPTGQGTGLGLSLSYEIITKGHDGELKVKSTPAEGAVFFITLPF
jgi:signal transduction histidine kinase